MVSGQQPAVNGDGSVSPLGSRAGIGTGSASPLTIRLHRIRLESATTLRSAREVIADREVILVEVSDGEGNVGWGECPALPRPGYSAEYLDGSWAVLRDVLVPDVVADPVAALARLATTPGHQMARAGLVGALVDLDLRVRRVPLASALADGAPTADRVRSNAVIGLCDSAAELEAAVGRALDDGHQSIKLKIGPARDVSTVGVVRRQWPDLPVALDANGSYDDADAAVAAISGIEESFGVFSYVEQPVAADDLVGSAVVARRLGSPVALDESITSVGDAVTAVSLGAMRVLNLKPARVGGPLAALAVGGIAAVEGIDVFCGGMVESGVGRAAALAFAAQPMCTLPTDLGPSSRYHRRDVTRDFTLADGWIDVPRAPGIGVDVDRDVLAAVTTNSWSHP